MLLPSAIRPSQRTTTLLWNWPASWAKADGVVYVATKSSDGKWTMAPVDLAEKPAGAVGQYIIAFGEDADGELYVLTNSSNSLRGTNGKVWKLVPE